MGGSAVRGPLRRGPLLQVAIGWGWIREADVTEALALHDRLAAMLYRMTQR